MKRTCAECYAAHVKIGITCYPTYGGSGIVATELGLELASRGHEVHFISYASPIRLDTGVARIHYHEVEVSTYPLFHYPPYCLALASRMAEVAASYDLDLLHVHYAIPHSVRAADQDRRRPPLPPSARPAQGSTADNETADTLRPPPRDNGFAQ